MEVYWFSGTGGKESTELQEDGTSWIEIPFLLICEFIPSLLGCAEVHDILAVVK